MSVAYSGMSVEGLRKTTSNLRIVVVTADYNRALLEHEFALPLSLGLELPTQGV
jgi:hypothetical protein